MLRVLGLRPIILRLCKSTVVVGPRDGSVALVAFPATRDDSIDSMQTCDLLFGNIFRYLTVKLKKVMVQNAPRTFMVYTCSRPKGGRKEACGAATLLHFQPPRKLHRE